MKLKLLNSQETAWLAFAVVVHALMLAIPFHQPQPAGSAPDSGRDYIAVQLSQPPRPQAPQPEQQPEPQPGVEPTPQPRAQTPAPPPVPPPAPNIDDLVESDLPLQDVTEEDDEEQELPSTATLLYSLEDGNWTFHLPESRGDKDTRLLGVFTPQAAPRNWQKGTGANYLNAEDNLFDGMTVPSEVEIVDRWLAADGSHNVVINTPTGHTLCGRGEAFDPMNPLVEHVMMFRPCGGGGERTFDMPRHEPVNRDFIIPVAKSATDQ